MLTGIIIPLAAFFWQYIEGKERRATILEISKTIDDPDRLDELMSMLDEKKSEPTDYRRGGVITLLLASAYTRSEHLHWDGCSREPEFSLVSLDSGS